jgi:hypothetical protein
MRLATEPFFASKTTELFPAISISDFQLQIFRNRRAIYMSSIRCGLFRVHSMFLLPYMVSVNGQ